jgi:hypothetical protein
MAVLLLLSLSFVFAAPQSVYKSIRDVDFKNFTFCWDQDTGWASEFRWLGSRRCEQVSLINGRWQEPMPKDERDDEPGFSRPFAGLIFEEVQYVRLMPGSEQAIVVLRLNSGGTQYSHYVFLYSLKDKQPRLLAAAHCGDRTYFGLSRIYVERRRMVLELFDPERRIGDCCSEGVIRREYRWRKGRFQEVSLPVYEKAPSVSRIPVDMFGQHP